MKALKIIGICVGVLFALAIGAVIVIGIVAPETYIYRGHEVPEKYVAKVRALGLLEEDDRIKYFYSDALFGIEEGMYFVTDRNLVLYSKEWEEPKTIIAYEDIVELTVDYDDSFFEDSYVFVETIDQLDVYFPISSEKGRDKEFVGYVEQRTELEANLMEIPE